MVDKLELIGDDDMNMKILSSNQMMSSDKYRH